jgi:hypothetical protein
MCLYTLERSCRVVYCDMTLLNGGKEIVICWRHNSDSGFVRRNVKYM